MESLINLEGVTPADNPLICPICGSALYPTDFGSAEITYHCSSPEARFWDYDRGSAELEAAKKHWDQSMREVYLHRG
jgi:hypothetical protein